MNKSLKFLIAELYYLRIYLSSFNVEEQNYYSKLNYKEYKTYNYKNYKNNPKELQINNDFKSKQNCKT